MASRKHRGRRPTRLRATGETPVIRRHSAELTGGVKATTINDGPKDPPKESIGWDVLRVRDELTNKVSYHTEFPTSSGVATYVFGVTETDDCKKLLKDFRSYEATIPGDTDDQRIEFLKTRIASANREPLIGTSKPGFTETGKGFVLGHTMLGDARNTRFWIEDASNPVSLGKSKGSPEDYRKLTTLLQHTSFGTVAVLAMLASAIPRYLKLHGKGVAGAPALIAETATFNFAAGSGSGKTLPSRIAASASGDPDDIGSWEGSRRGQEEYLSSRNEVGAIFDDVEKLTNSAQNLKAGIEIIERDHAL
jgi:hypothetical protein